MRERSEGIFTGRPSKEEVLRLNFEGEFEEILSGIIRLFLIFKRPFWEILRFSFRKVFYIFIDNVKGVTMQLGVNFLSFFA